MKGFVEDVLVGKCGYRHREVLMLGFGQGGMAALRGGRKLAYSFASFILSDYFDLEL